MKHIYALAALPVLACGFVLAGSAQASARVIYPEESYSGSVVVVHEPGPTIRVDDNLAEAVQTGVGAIGGAAVAMATLWAYRRRYPAGAH
ncbi:hypothetical protein E0H73_38900 [Kribbella pittospori]|uniref:Uncharacterized protein n=1 Tax=Kribbella pittospori TaxID=722689 RepID=A0A4R0K4C7_9ACTN|nr:hypothetical protein [Kribbella pittospori]TCC54419.1 hypothetical protein E0H73_38900 [Kribbella pittospori]